MALPMLSPFWSSQFSSSRFGWSLLMTRLDMTQTGSPGRISQWSWKFHPVYLLANRGLYHLINGVILGSLSPIVVKGHATPTGFQLPQVTQLPHFLNHLCPTFFTPLFHHTALFPLGESEEWNGEIDFYFSIHITSLPCVVAGNTTFLVRSLSRQ